MAAEHSRTEITRRDHELTRLCARHRRAVVSYLYACCRDLHVAEDLCQEAFLVATRRFDDFETGSDFLAWILTIARYRWFKERDRSSRREHSCAWVHEHAAEVFGGTDEGDAVQEAQHEDERRALARCLKKLQDRDRELITRHFHDGETYPSIAGAMERSLSWVKVRMHRLRKALADCVTHSLEGQIHG